MEVYRSKYLTITCILAWVNSAILFILSLSTLLSLQTFSDSLKMALQNKGNDDLYDGLWVYLENIQNYGYILYILYIFCAAISLFAIKMIWSKMKTGLYIYSFLIFLPPLASFILHFHSSNIVLFIIGIQAIISVAFILAFLFRAKELTE